VKLLNKRHPCENKDSTHNKRSKNTPKQYFVLVLCIDIELRKNHDKHKKVIDAQRLFDDIPG
jgi:triosephosphate isomerase